MRFKKLSVIAMVFIQISLNAYAQENKTRPDVFLQCGGYEVRIKCGKTAPRFPDDERQCNNNTLSFKNLTNGKTTFAQETKRQRSAGSTASSIACISTKDGNPLVEIEYSTGINCGLCEHYYETFTPNGKRLTANGRPIDKSYNDSIINYKEQVKPIEIETIQRP